jgi:hypothetical protein
MASIKVKDLGSNIAGADLFSDSESFMRELSNDEVISQVGGHSVIRFAIYLVLSFLE